MDDVRARLVVLLLRAPQVLKRRHRRENRAADPQLVLTLGRRDDLHLHAARTKAREILLHAVRDARGHRRATGEHDVAVQVASDVDVTLEDRVVRRLVHTRGLEAEEGRLEERLGRAEALIVDGDDLPVRELVAILERGRLRRGLELLLKVERKVAGLLLSSHDLTLGNRREGVAALSEVFDQQVGDVAAGEIEAENGVRERKVLVDGGGVAHTVARAEHDSS